MTVGQGFVVSCDDCGARHVGVNIENARQAVIAALDDGWVTRAWGPLHQCPNCFEDES